MSKASDELRDFVEENDLYASQIAKLNTIADRIDAEMVELPRDKDGEPIHLGDTVYDKYGIAWHVRGVTLTYDAASTSNCVIRAGSEKGGIRGLNPEMLTHERPDSLERIADEIEEADVDGCTDWADRIRKFAKERGDE